MLGKKEMNDVNRAGDLNTIIGKGTVVKGSIKVVNSVRIDGKIKGDVTADESVVIGKDGVVEGQVYVKNGIIGGRLDGNISAEGKIVLEANSFFRGEMKTAKLVIDEGAIFEGKCSMAGEPDKDKNSRPKGLFDKVNGAKDQGESQK